MISKTRAYDEISYSHQRTETQSDGLLQPSWWVDASFATHHDMKSHTGGLMTLGKGAVYATSRRQKINTRSSTEAELVGMNDVLSQILWTRYFMEAQGYQCKITPIYQDNMSTILLAKNGRMSSSKLTRHINVRYFFINDKIVKRKLRLSTVLLVTRQLICSQNHCREISSKNQG